MDDPFDLVGRGNLEGLRAVLEANPSLARMRNASGASLLAWAHYAGKPDAAPLIRNHLDQLDPYDAIVADDIGAVHRAMDGGWDPNQLSPDGFTPLGLAAFFNRPAIFSFLLQLTRDVNQRAENPQRVAALHAAVAQRNAAMVEALLRADADPNLAQSDGFTPLHVAAAHGDTPVVAMLLMFGANPLATNDKGESAIDYARARGHEWLAQRLEARV